MEGLVLTERRERSWLTVCAACKRIEVSPQSWMAPEIFLLDDMKLRVDHGLCPPCEAAFAREGHGRRQEPDRTYVCASCKKVREGIAEWTPLPAYLGARLGVRVIHGICPPCLDEL